MSIWTAESLQRQIDNDNRSIRRTRTERTRARELERRDARLPLLAIAQRYEAECQRIRDLSGYPATAARAKTAEDALFSLVLAVLRQPAKSMSGVVIQAQAVEAAYRLDWRGAFFTEIENRQSFSEMLASSLLQIAGCAA